MIQTVLLIVLEGLFAAQTPALLDLEANPSKPWSEPAISGTFEGRSSHDSRPEPKLQLEIELRSIEPIPERQRERLVTIVIRNIGSEPYSLPVGRDPEVALKPANHGRREFWFNLQLANQRYAHLRGPRTYASTDLPDTMMILSPRESVRVRFPLDLVAGIRTLSSHHWLPEGQTELVVHAAVVDSAFDDNPEKYVQHLPEPGAISANQLRVTIPQAGEAGKTMVK